MYESVVHDGDKRLSKNLPHACVEPVACAVIPEPIGGQIDVGEFAFSDHDAGDAPAIRGDRRRFCNLHACRRGTFQLGRDRYGQGRTRRREIDCEHDGGEEETEQYDEERIQSG